MSPTGSAPPVTRRCSWGPISSWIPASPLFVPRILPWAYGICIKMGMPLCHAPLDLLSFLHLLFHRRCARWADNGVWLMNDGSKFCGAHYTIELNQEYVLFPFRFLSFCSPLHLFFPFLFFSLSFLIIQLQATSYYFSIN